MGNLLTYGGIVTKIRAMESKLLTPGDFEEIAGLHGVPAVIAWLRDNGFYPFVLDDLTDEHLPRGDIEKLLINQLYYDYMKIFRFCGLEQRKFLTLYIMRYETDLIDYCLRIVINHYQEPFDLNYKKDFFDRYSQISIEKLITSRTTDQLIENLKDTEYYKPLSALRDKAGITLFDYDLALDQYRFHKLWKNRKNILNKTEREIYTRSYGSKIDLLNLQWIYRAKKYYGMEPVDIYNMLIPVHFKISTELVKELVEAPTADDFLNAMRKVSYTKDPDFLSSLTLEQMYRKCLKQLYVADARRNPYSIASIYAYLFKKEEELERLTAAIECVRYGLPPNETLAHCGLAV